MLGLAAHLDALPREALLDGLRRRSFTATGAVDVFDLADALLATDAVDAALERLGRPTLAVLAAAARRADAAGAATVDGIAAELEALGAGSAVRDGLAAALGLLEELFLVIGTGGDALLVPPLLARRVLDRLGDSLPTAEALAASPSPIPVAGPDGVDRRLAERRAAEIAHATVTGLAEVIVQLSTQPARELAKGGLALPDARRLAEAATMELEQLPELVGIAKRAGFIVREGSEWLETDAGADWLRLGNAARWRELAEIWLRGIRPQLLELTNRRGDAVTAEALREDVAWFYPAGGTRLREAAEAVLREAEALGITIAGDPSDAGRAVLAGRLAEAESAMAALFPEQVDRVYVQHDLTIVAPGPLEPAVDAQLRGFADIEGRDLASSYRVTPASVNRALAAGQTADAIRAFLDRVSLTGIPQPLEYLLAESSERFGSIRVTEATADDAPARSVVRADDAAVLRTLEVDQGLAPIALMPLGDDRLGSRFPIDIVFWALSDARYPAAAEDAEGRIVRLRRNRLGRIAQPKATVDPLEQLVDRVREASGEATEAGWLARQLESAARSKETLTVSVRMPGGEVSDYLLAPSSVANGRLRARDRRTDIERTLPLSAIAAIAPAIAE
ncbi:helicase-associated domain-containing protein [Agromyces archimandritae]|uniref:Helicase-associated domain-containing protein n=1 Tax=Agromyces archimandritae TaxID=2781962 RepID=A0A975FLC5_9MICO|nr:helicase-associated domain-containing protein [Agromyces archimandritae]QTX04001.1 helicase-associated domain-containing protein [Agromyces archimandritae]